MFRTFYATAIVVLGLLSAVEARACTWMPPLDLRNAAFADMVFEGRLTGYEAFPYPDNPAYVTHAIATFEVLDVIAGKVPDQVSVLLLDNLTGVHDTWRWDPVVIVATVLPGTPDSAQTDYLNPRPDLPVLLHPTCGTPFVAPATDDTRAAIATALAQAIR